MATSGEASRRFSDAESFGGLRRGSEDSGVSLEPPPLPSKPQSRWLPLPHLLSGVCIYPFHPDPPSSATSTIQSPLSAQQSGQPAKPSSASKTQNRFSWSGFSGAGSGSTGVNGHAAGHPQAASRKKSSATDGQRNMHEVPLDLGDEFFAFEAWDDPHTGLWYRGYVMPAPSIKLLSPSPASLLAHATHNAEISQDIFPRPEAVVLIGIFPAAVVSVRPSGVDENPALQAAYEEAVRVAHRSQGGHGIGNEHEGDVKPAMEAVQEEDEESDSPSPLYRNDARNATQQRGERGDEGNYVSIPRTPSPTSPKRRSSDGSASAYIKSGETPGVIEGLLHIHAREDSGDLLRTPDRNGQREGRPISLQLDQAGPSRRRDEGRRKEEAPLPSLTAGDTTLAGLNLPIVDEIACAVREWYARLPTYLALREYRLFSTVSQHTDALLLGRRQLLSQTLSDAELARVKRECVSRLVKCNVAQGLEVIVRSLEDGSVVVVNRDRAPTEMSRVGAITAYVYQVQLAYIDLVPLGTLFGSKPLAAPPFNQRLSLQAIGLDPIPTPSLYYHFCLDVRAFVASPCSPGETAELYFSLFNKAEGNFISEEYLLVLNHLGSPARDAEQRLGRLRTLFTQIKQEDLKGGLYLVCRLIRNGGFKMRSEPGSAVDTARRTSVRATGSHLGASSMSLASTANTIRTQASTSALSAVSEASWSDGASAFDGHRTQTTDTSNTVTHSVVDGRPTFRRPLGVAVLELPQLGKMMSDGSEKGAAEFSMPIFAPREEGSFAGLHQDIISGKMSNTMSNPRQVEAQSIAVAVRMLHGDAASLVQEHPPLLADVPFTRRLNFPDVVQAGVERHDLYIKLWSASFSISTPQSSSLRLRQTASSNSATNVQITLELRRSDGTYIPDAIYSGGSGEPAVQQWHSTVFAQLDNPTYGELIRVQIPQHALMPNSPSLSRSTSDVHLFATFRSRAKDRNAQQPMELERPFAFAYLPLWGTDTVKDGPHDLVLHHWDGRDVPSPRTYLEPTRGTEDRASTANLSLRELGASKDRLVIRTSLVSTLLSQDDTLSELFDWRALVGHPEPLLDVLKRFAFTDEAEISKFLPRALDALFGILTSDIADDRVDTIRSLVLSGLVKVLLMSTDRRFPNYLAVLDVYIARQYLYPSASPFLLDMMQQTMSSANTTEYRSFLKIWHLFFRFIIRSRDLERSRGVGLDATSAHMEATFTYRVKDVLEGLNRLMRRKEDSLIGTKTLAVQHFADLLPSLAHVFAPVQLAEMVIAFADTLTQVKGNLAVYKLLLVLQVVKEIFDAADARALLIPAIVRWVKPHLGRYMLDEAMMPDFRSRLGEGLSGDAKGRDARKGKWLECSRLAVTVVAWTINRLEEWLESPAIQENQTLFDQERDNLEYCLELLPALCETYAEHNSTSTQDTLSRLRSEGTTWKETPDVFPSSHPFALISSLPPPSLIVQNRQAHEGGLPDVGTFYPCRAECAIVILSLLLSVPRENLDNYLAEMLDIQGRESTSTRLGLLISVAQSVVAGAAFPENWMTINLVALSGVIKVMHAIGHLLQHPDFLPTPASGGTEAANGRPEDSANGDDASLQDTSRPFDVDLWKSIFALLCDYCASPQLSLEDHTTQRRRAGWIMVGDLRDEGATLLLKLWNTLPRQQQSQFLGLADQVLTLCTSSHDQLCEMAVDILFSMMVAEHETTGAFSQVESQVFDQLDSLFTPKGSFNANESTMRAYFITQLRTLFSSHTDLTPSFSAAFNHFLEQVEHFISLLLQLREIPDSAQWADERADAIFQLMDFVQRQGRTPLYVRFASQLVGIHLEAGDEVTAAFAIHLQALAYDWGEEREKGEVVPPMLGYGTRKSDQASRLPAQTPWARRESLYCLAIDHFTNGEAYEMALDLCHELATKHRDVTYDLDKLVQLYNQQAALWTRIGESLRMKPEYYRVVFMLKRGTALDRSRDFIVRSSRGKDISTFLEQLEDRFPSADIYRLKIPPPQRLVERGDLIWVYPVVPELDPARPHPAAREGVHPHIQEWYKNNGLNRFISTRPFKKDDGPSAGIGEEGGEVVWMWLEKTILTTREALPCALTRSEVVSIAYEQISPVAHATSEVMRASANLKKLYNPRQGAMIDVKMLGTAINGAVSSPVSGGVSLYRDTFVDSSFRADRPGSASEVQELQDALEVYGQCVLKALRVHEKVCKDIAFHEALKSHFRRTFPDEAHGLSRASESTSDRHPSLDQPLSSATSSLAASRGGLTNSQSFSAISALSRKTSNAISPSHSGPYPASGMGLASILKPPGNPALTVAMNPRRLSQISDTSRTSGSDVGSNGKGGRGSRLFGSFRRQTNGSTAGDAGDESGEVGVVDEAARDRSDSGAATPTMPGIRVDRPSLDQDHNVEGERSRVSYDGSASVRTGMSGLSNTGSGGGGMRASGSGNVNRLSQLFGGSRSPSVRSGTSGHTAISQSAHTGTTTNDQLRPGGRTSPLPSPPSSGLGSEFGYLAPALVGGTVAGGGSSAPDANEAGGADPSAGGLGVPDHTAGQGQGSMRRKGVMNRLSTIMRR